MRRVMCSNLRFDLPLGDTLFHRALPSFVAELPDTLRLLRRYGSFTSNGELLDVGACFGVTGIVGLRSGLFRRVHAFEPLAANAELARHNAALNGYGPDVYHVHTCALGERDGTEGFWTPPVENIGGGFLNKAESARVSLQRLDTLVERGVLDPAAITFIWVDAQGAEARILSGGSTLNTGRIPWCIELSPHLLQYQGCSSERLQRLLRNFNRVIELRFLRQPLKLPDGIRALYQLWDHIRRRRRDKSWHTNLLLYRQVRAS